MPKILCFSLGNKKQLRVTSLDREWKLLKLYGFPSYLHGISITCTEIAPLCRRDTLPQMKNQG